MKKTLNNPISIGDDRYESACPRSIQENLNSSFHLEQENLRVDSLLDSFFNLNSHPCLGAHSVMNTRNYSYNIYNELGEKESAIRLCTDIYKFLDELPNKRSTKLCSYFALFKNSNFSSELEFENKLWKHLQYAHEYDIKKFKWDSKVSSDVDETNFSFSIGERGFYIVGMHPYSSRKARKFPNTLLVFNLHEQFEALRSRGKYDKLKNSIRKRDEKINGSINPMMHDFGASSEARQYSGRLVENDWECPFNFKSE